MSNSSPTSDDQIGFYLNFFDALSHDLAMFASEHPELLPPLSPEELAKEQTDIARMTAQTKELIALARAGKLERRPRPAPTEPTAAEARSRRAQLVLLLQNLRRLVEGYRDMEQLLDAYANGCTGEDARARAGLTVDAYHAALVRIHALV